jgi:hypothetical protein
MDPMKKEKSTLHSAINTNKNKNFALSKILRSEIFSAKFFFQN